MKTLVFDAGPIISMTMNNLLWLLKPLKKQFDGLATRTKLVGWSDMMLQVIVMCGKGKVVVNQELIEPWMEDNWKDYEMVNYLKDITQL